MIEDKNIDKGQIQHFVMFLAKATINKSRNNRICKFFRKLKANQIHQNIKLWLGGKYASSPSYR